MKKAYPLHYKEPLVPSSGIDIVLAASSTPPFDGPTWDQWRQSQGYPCPSREVPCPGPMGNRAKRRSLPRA